LVCVFGTRRNVDSVVEFPLSLIRSVATAYSGLAELDLRYDRRLDLVSVVVKHLVPEVDYLIAYGFFCA
jgi:hypothetical protein